MAQRSLAQLLTRQWMLFALALSALFAGATLLLLFLLEDSFIDRRVREVAALVADPATAQGLPAGFQIYLPDQLPPEITAPAARAGFDEAFELRLADGRHVHVLLTRSAAASTPFAIVHDATDELTVTPSLATGFGVALVLIALILIVAHALARVFVRGAADTASALADDIRRSPDPARLRALAADQDIEEFARLLALHADVWAAQLAAVERERQMLAYLGHELRTPLQSANTSMALLHESRDNQAAWARLERAVSRLTRASNAILWLATDRDLEPASPQSAAAVIHDLVGELRPLAQRKQQQIDVDVAAGVSWSVPTVVAETILANLLLNAIQHGSAGAIVIRADQQCLTLTNPVAASDTATPGFSLGLELVERLATRLGWQVSRSSTATQVKCELRYAGTPSAPVS